MPFCLRERPPPTAGSTKYKQSTSNHGLTTSGHLLGTSDQSLFYPYESDGRSDLGLLGAHTPFPAVVFFWGVLAVDWAEVWRSVRGVLLLYSTIYLYLAFAFAFSLSAVGSTAKYRYGVST